SKRVCTQGKYKCKALVRAANDGTVEAVSALTMTPDLLPSGFGPADLAAAYNLVPPTLPEPSRSSLRSTTRTPRATWARRVRPRAGGAPASNVQWVHSGPQPAAPSKLRKRGSASRVTRGAPRANR